MKPIELEEDDDDLVQLLAALGSSARLRIIQILTKDPQSNCADIVRKLPLGHATVSQHLGVLTDAGLVSSGNTPSGKRCCAINHTMVSQLAQQGRGVVSSGSCATCVRSRVDACIQTTP